MRFWQFVRDGTDVTSVAVLMEDCAAVTGVSIAALGVSLSHWTNNPLVNKKKKKKKEEERR
jgi:hypothetical protein